MEKKHIMTTKGYLFSVARQIANEFIKKTKDNKLIVPKPTSSFPVAPDWFKEYGEVTNEHVYTGLNIVHPKNGKTFVVSLDFFAKGPLNRIAYAVVTTPEGVGVTITPRNDVRLKFDGLIIDVSADIYEKGKEIYPSVTVYASYDYKDGVTLDLGYVPEDAQWKPA